MNYDYGNKKIVAVLASNLEIGIAFNVLGHLAVAVGAFSDRDDIMVRNQLLDNSKIKHLGISKYPFIITKVKPGRLRKLIEDARNMSNILMVDFPRQMLDTGHDDELAQALLAVNESEIDYLGAILYGDVKEISELTGNFSLWK